MSEEYTTPSPAIPAPPPLPEPAGIVHRCSGHPAVAALYSCDRCGALLCPTCAFELPGPKHMCPSCAVNSVNSISPRRRRAIIAGYAFGVGAAVGLALVMTGAIVSALDNEVNAMLLGYLFTFIVLAPAATGLAWSWGAVEKRLRNPGALWGAVVLNAIIVISFLALSIIGLLSE